MRMKAKRLLSSGAFGTGVLCMLALLFVATGCRTEVDMSNIDTTAEVEFGVALPVGTLSVRLGDLLGATVDGSSNLYYRADGTLCFRVDTTMKESFHKITLTEYVSSAEQEMNLYEPIQAAIEEVRSSLPSWIASQIPDGVIVGIEGYPIHVPVAFDMGLVFQGINNNVSSERIDSISVTRALLNATLTDQNLPFDFAWIDTIMIVFGKQFRLNGANTYMLYDKSVSGSEGHAFGEKMPIDIQTFLLDMVKDHSRGPGMDNVLDSTSLQIYISLTIPENAESRPLTDDMAIVFGMDVQVLDFDAIWGMFEASEYMRDARELDIRGSFPNWDLLKDMRLPLAEPSITVDVTHHMAGPLFIQGNYLYTRSDNGDVRYALFGEEESHTVRYPDDLATNPDSWLSPIGTPLDATQSFTIRFDNTPRWGQIDNLFSIRPDYFGYNFFVDFDETVADQVRLSANTDVKIDAAIDVPFSFHEGFYMSYRDTMPNLNLNAMTLDSVRNSVVDSITQSDAKLKLRVENTLPLSVRLVLHCLDSDGREIMDSEDPTRPLRLSSVDTIEVVAPEYGVVGDSLVMTAPGKTEEFLSVDESQFKEYDRVANIVYEIILDNRSLGAVMEEHPEFTSRITQDAQLKIGLGIGMKVGAILNFTNN